MNRIVKSGKILKFGASNWTSERICAANSYAQQKGLMSFSASQIRFNPAYCLGERGGLVGMDEKEFEFYKKLICPLWHIPHRQKAFSQKWLSLVKTHFGRD